MSSGAIPVFIGRDLVPPFREQFDWGSFSFMFSPDQIGPAMIQTLRNVPPEELRAMQVRPGCAREPGYFMRLVDHFESQSSIKLETKSRKIECECDHMAVEYVWVFMEACFTREGWLFELAVLSPICAEKVPGWGR